MGTGLGHSRQKYLWLPEPQNDFIFAIIGEELGLIGCIVVMMLFLILVYRCIRIALKCSDIFSCMVVIGIGAQIGIQAALNIAVATSSMPATGVALPFISMGGTSLTILMGAVGIAVSYTHLYQELLEEYSDKEKINGYYAMWRNPLINDTYEPGSTFKLITSSASVEEGVVSDKDKFVCTGSVTVGGRKIKCWRHYRPHGEQTFAQGVQNSCNPVFVELSNRLGVSKFYDYIEAFGFKSKTGIDLPGEAKGIIYNEKNVGPVELATMSFRCV